jgi:hypothetical protein
MAALPQLNSNATPRASYRTTRKFEMRPVTFPESVMESIKTWLHEQIRVRRLQLEKRHKKLVPEWRRIIEGKPREENKSWPFENCANLVHQVCGEASEDMAARVMQMIWATSPIILYKYFTKSAGQEEAAHNSKKSGLLQQFMDYVAYEPNELDLYEKENIWFKSSSDLGTAWLCCVPEQRIESVYVGYEETKQRTSFESATLYEGPKVVNLDDEDVLYDPEADTPEESDFISRRSTLTKRKLQEREFKQQYKKGTVALILGKPDRYGPDENEKRRAKNKGVTPIEEQQLAEWDIEECYFYWYHNRKKFRLIAWFHYETKTLMNCVFNFIPENQLPLVRTRLSSGEKGMNGRGLADIGKDGQEEISTTKNQRIDMTTWIMMGINRVDPSNRNIDKNFKIFPGSSVPFGKDQFEHYAVGDPAALAASQRNEEMMIQQMRDRFGIAPAVAGQGAGGLQGRGRNAQYGSMGTLAVMQDSNTRTAHRTSDFRHAHVKLFGLLTDMYGAMGLGRKGSLFGLDDSLLSEALSDYLERRVRIPIRAATASANREVTKQNELLLNQALMMFVKECTTLMQAIGNAGMPPQVSKWLQAILKARVRLMQQIVRDFQLSDQPEEYVPEIELPGEGQPNATQRPQAGVDSRILEMANRFSGRGGAGAAGIVPGVATGDSGPDGGAQG